MGWSHFSGTLDAAVGDYFSWPRTVDGVTATSTTYATTQTVDDTIAWLAEQGPDQPWMVWLAFNAPHAPFHAPPSELHDYNLQDGSSPFGLDQSQRDLAVLPRREPGDGY